MRGALDGIIIATCRLVTATAAVIVAIGGEQVSHAAYTVALPKAIITHAVPNPSSGPEIVELTVSEVTLKPVYLPVISKQPAGAPSFELGTPPSLDQSGALNIAGWELSNDAGATYALPASLTAVPVGTTVRVYFDGLGAASDDYDLGDHLIELHTPASLVNVFPNTSGQVTLYSGTNHSQFTLRDRQAWTLDAE